MYDVKVLYLWNNIGVCEHICMNVDILLELQILILKIIFLVLSRANTTSSRIMCEYSGV
jgi:hypothetical protein